jgi:hypothetical protein
VTAITETQAVSAAKTTGMMARKSAAKCMVFGAKILVMFVVVFGQFVNQFGKLTGQDGCRSGRNIAAKIKQDGQEQNPLG